MDSFIYALVLVPSLTELLPRSAIAATPGNIGYYGGILFALFLIGWGLAFLWGPVADRFGRVRTLMLTILWYSAFTLLGAFSRSVMELAILRVLAGIGIGGEWAMGGTYVSEAWPESRRQTGAGLMHTGYYAGVILAALANMTVGTHFGWRAMFVVGGLPALLVLLVQRGVTEPERWKHTVEEKRSRSLWEPFAAIFSPTYRRRTLVNSLFMLVSVTGLWGGTVYVPAAVTYLARLAGHSASESANYSSLAVVLMAIATIIGCLAMPWMANQWGRRGAIAIFFAVMCAFLILGFGYIYYQPSHPLGRFIACMFFLGFGGANLAVYTLWLPEQYSTDCRASAFAFGTSFARFVGAGTTFLVGAGVSRFGTLGTPVALTSIAFVLGLLLVPLGVETRGKPLPS
jgi:MFS family permease